jgi:hypothetical protein
MNLKSHENLRVIRFEEELLPNWAQLLDLAARLCPLSENTRGWFSNFTNSSGVDDARTVEEQCKLLHANIQEHRVSISTNLQRNRTDAQPSQIIGAWIYALETIIQVSRKKKTCSWIVEGTEEKSPGDFDGGDISLRRV